MFENITDILEEEEQAANSAKWDEISETVETVDVPDSNTTWNELNVIPKEEFITTKKDLVESIKKVKVMVEKKEKAPITIISTKSHSISFTYKGRTCCVPPFGVLYNLDLDALGILPKGISLLKN